jgi:hypothetical protein
VLEKSLSEEAGSREASNNNRDNSLNKGVEEVKIISQCSTNNKSLASAAMYSSIPIPSLQKDSASQEVASQIVEPTVTNPLLKQPESRHRSTRLELADTLRKIRYMIGQAHTNEEIMSTLNLSPATFYRYLAKIHAQDRELFLQQDIGAIEFEAHTLKDKLLRAERWYNKMADDESLGPGYRMQAKYAATDVAMTILKLTNEGLMSVDKVRRFAKTGKMMPQEFPQFYDNVVDALEGRNQIGSSSREEQEAR